MCFITKYYIIVIKAVLHDNVIRLLIFIKLDIL